MYRLAVMVLVSLLSAAVFADPGENTTAGSQLIFARQTPAPSLATTSKTALPRLPGSPVTPQAPDYFQAGPADQSSASWLNFRSGQYNLDKGYSSRDQDLTAGRLGLHSDGDYMAVDGSLGLTKNVFLGALAGSLEWNTSMTTMGLGGAGRSGAFGRDDFWGLRGGLLINDGNAAITGFFNGYNRDVGQPNMNTSNTLGLGLEFRM